MGYIVGHSAFTTVTNSLTVYALIGTDVQMMATTKSADMTFDIITIVCIVVFAVEIVLSSVGKDDYIFGFFFVLDIASTITLFLDLSFVYDVIFENQSMGFQPSTIARVGRVVRVLRLVRILKLYKVIYEARQAKIK